MVGGGLSVRLAAMPGMSDHAARIHAYEHGTLALVADEVVEIPEGYVARSAALPAVWALNRVVVNRPVEYAEALELVERHQAELPYRHLVVEHEPSGEVLERRLRSEGWQLERNVGMVLRRDPDRALDRARS